MVLHAYTTKAALLIALTFVLAACSKQDQQPAPSAPAAASSAFRAGNGDKTMTLADCDRLPDPKPADDSAAGRATAVSQGMATRAACKKEVAAQQDKPNTDLARIREIKENEEAERVGRKVSEAEWKRGVKEGASQPLKGYKY